MTYLPGTLDLRSVQLLSVGTSGIVDGLTMMTSPTFEVSGIVVDKAGRPVVGALVALDARWPLFGGPKGSSQTDAKGRVRIGFIAAREYRLTVTPPGIEPSPVTRQTPFVRMTVVDADVSSLTIRSR